MRKTQTPDAKKIAHVYDEFGQAYHNSRRGGHGRLFNEYIDIPSTLYLLPKNLKGKKVLDAGCGSGIYTQLLAQKGAIVTGIDISRKMIEIARKETPKELNVKYYVGNLYDLPFENKTFNLIICTYVLENIKNLAPVCEEFHRVLTKKGECIVTISHPIRAQSEKVDMGGKEVWVITDYFKKGMRDSDFGGGMMVPKYKRTLEDYMQAFLSAGFVLTNLLEPRPTRKGKEVDAVGYEKAMRLPQLLALKLRREV